ncbi:MAG: lasso peptide biosynthesis B2 protein [Ardenticatenia bacterium]|nr:lasso peptide biosynthesis B2 protein [Ardenticatenia bacterium]
MDKLRKFRHLPATERRLLVSAAFWLLAMRLALVLLPFRFMPRLPALVARLRRPARKTEVAPERIAWAVRVAERHLPGRRTCLVQALAAQTLLLRQGYDARLRIGVGRDEAGGFRAHAWVEYEGGILLGGSAESVGRAYRAFPALQEERS